MPDRRAVAIAGAMLAAVVAVGSLEMLDDVLRVVVGVLVLVLPGYAIGRALLPPRSLDASGLLAVALASGVGLMVLGGLLLDRLPPGLSGTAWLALSVITVLVSIRFAVARGYVSPASWASTRRWVAAQTTLGGRVAGPPAIQALTVTLAILLATTALALAREGQAQHDRAQAFTEFWAVLDRVGSGEVRLGIASHEPAPTDYSLTVESGGRSIAAFDRIRLDSGESWEWTVTLPVVPGTVPTNTGPIPSGATPAHVLASSMRAILYRAGSSTPYREVTLQGPVPP